MLEVVFWVVLLVVVFPAAVAALAAKYRGANVRKASLLVAAINVPIVLVVVALLSANSVTATGDEVQIRAFGMYTIRVPANALERPRLIAKSRAELGEWTPVLRTNGVAVPGYSAGWFRLDNGHRAFVLLSDERSAVLVYPGAVDGSDLLIDAQYLEGASPALLAPPLRDP